MTVRLAYLPTKTARRSAYFRAEKDGAAPKHFEKEFRDILARIHAVNDFLYQT
jgi:hypothetical protein